MASPEEVVRMRRLIVTIIAAGALSAGMIATAAAHEANGHASCVGIELSAISPPGSSDEVPGGAAEFGAEVKAIAASLGLPAGRVISLFIAPLHAGSHEDCDAALGG
jgi:hypothetical protein